MSIQHEDDPHQFWDQRIKTSRWLIFKTCAWGVLAAILGVLGQGWLESASPLLPIISQNYGIWQTAYVLALAVIFVLWLLAMRQKIGLLDNSRQGKAMQHRIDEQNERRDQKRLEAREARERRAAEQSALDIRHTPSLFKSKRRSTKFDY